MQQPQTQTQPLPAARDAQRQYTIHQESGAAVRIGAPAGEYITVDMFTPTGRLFRTVYSGTAGAVNHVVPITDGLMPTGLYLLRLRGCRSTEIIRVFNARR